MYWLVLDVFGKCFASADVFFSPETKFGNNAKNIELKLNLAVFLLCDAKNWA